MNKNARLCRFAQQRTIILLTSIIMMAGNIMAQQTINLLVGTYTDGSSCGIYSYRFDQMTGRVVGLLDSLALRNPSFLTIAPDKKHIYAVSETNDQHASLCTIGYQPHNGQLKLLSTTATEGEDPCYVETNGKLVLTANYSGGSMIVFSLNPDGSRTTLAALFQGGTGGPDLSRQETPHIHCARFTPDGHYILATDFSADRILSYKRNDTTVTVNGEACYVRTDDGPRHLIFINDGRYAYLMSELSGKVSVFSYAEGRLKLLQTIVSDSMGARGGADIHLSPDGQFLYTSNRLKADGIAIFKVDASTGLLTKIGYQPTGLHPRHFNITPNGRFLLCACRDSNKIQVFSRNPETGLLSDTHQDIPISKVVCVQMH